VDGFLPSAIGYCAPESADPAAVAVLWVIQPGVPRPVPLDSLESLDGYGDAGRGEAFAPPSDLGQSAGGWPIGRYVLEIRATASAEGSLWFAFQLFPAPSRGPTPSNDR
jgi:hypothetical protein